MLSNFWQSPLFVAVLFLAACLAVGALAWQLKRRPAPRLFGWLIATFVLLAVIALLSPQQLPVSLYKLSLVSMAGVAGYWLDRSLFPYARPDEFMALPSSVGSPFVSKRAVAPAQQIVFAAAMLRRAFIVVGAMLAIGLGA